MLTVNTDSVLVEITGDIFRHTTRLPPLNCGETSCALFKEHLDALLALTSSRSHWCAIALADPILWTDIFVDVMSPSLLHLHLGRSASSHLDMAVNDPHSVTHFVICDEAYRFRRFIVDDVKLPPIWGGAFLSAASHIGGLRIDAHPATHLSDSSF